MISVILCTFNRCEQLREALKSIMSSVLSPSSPWEIVVVDNNSTDQTRDVVEDLIRHYDGRLRYVFEPRQGKSHALNTGVREAAGDILAFVDDDVIVDSAWLSNLTQPLRGGEWAGAGGRILPAESFSPPRWLAVNGPYSLAWMIYAHFDLGDEPCQLDCAPFGTNMAFQKALFEKYGGFRVDLGPSSTRDLPHFNDDTEFGRRLMAAGERLWYQPSAVVYHRVPKERIEQRFLLNLWFDLGRASIREAGRRPDIAGIPRYYFSIPRGVVTALFGTWRWLRAAEPQQRFFLKGRTWFSVGATIQLLRDAIRKDWHTDHRKERAQARGFHRAST